METLRTASNNFEDYEFEDLAAAVQEYEPKLAFSFSENWQAPAAYHQ